MSKAIKTTAQWLTLRLMNKWILVEGDRTVGQDQFVKYFS